MKRFKGWVGWDSSRAENTPLAESAPPNTARPDDRVDYLAQHSEHSLTGVHLHAEDTISDFVFHTPKEHKDFNWRHAVIHPQRYMYGSPLNF